MNEYTSLSRLRTQLTLASQDTGDDAALLRFLRNSSRAIDKFTRRRFYPERKTLFYDLPKDAQVVKFGRQDVLEIKGLSDLNGASEVNNTVYFLKCGDDHNQTPYDRLEISTSTGCVLNYSGTVQKAIHVDTVLGFHKDYNNAWIDSGASLTDGLNAGTSNTLASVSGSAGMNSWGESPRFSTEQIWRLSGGASNEEYVKVLDTHPGIGNDSASVIRLVRGINGTSAYDHAASETVEVWNVEYDIEEATRELAAWAYHKSKSPFTNTIAVPQMGIIEMPGAWPVDLKMRLERFQKRKLYSSRF